MVRNVTTPSAPPPETSTGQPILPRPSLPPTDVPDDAVHGDDLDAAREARILAQQAARPAAPATPHPPTPPMSPGQAQPPSPVHRGHGRGRSWLAVLAGVGILAGSFGGFLGSSDDEVEKYGAVSTIVVEDSMDVEIVTGAATGTVEVARELHWSLAASRPKAVDGVTDGTLTLSEPECSGFGRCRVDYVISVPEGVDLVVRSESGDLSAQGDFGSLELRTDSGDIEAGGLSATDLRMTTGSGDVELDALEAQNVTAQTGSGDIELEVAQAPERLTAKTGSGDVEVKVPDDETYKVDATTGSGDRNVDVPTGTGQEHVIFVDTGSGDVDIDDN